MEEKLFETLLNLSKDNVNNKMNDMYFYNYIYKSIVKKVQDLYDENGNLSSEDVERILYGELDQYLINQSNVDVKGFVFKQLVQERLKQNPLELRKIYKQVVNEIDEEYENGIKYNKIQMNSGNYEDTKFEYVKYSIVYLRAIQEKLILDYAGIEDPKDEMFKDVKDIIINLSNLGTNQRKRFLAKKRMKDFNIEYLVPFFKGSELDQLEYWIKKYGYDYEEIIKNRCIQGILLNIDFLDKYGILDEQILKKQKFYKRISKTNYVQNEELSNLINELSYSKDEILEMFLEDNLKKRSLKQLIAINAELSNIATKSINDINRILFLIKQLDLIDDIKNGENLLLTDSNSEKLNPTTIKAVFEKSSIMQGLVKIILKEMNMENKISQSTDQKVKRLSKSYVNDYKNYFSKTLPYSNNDVLEDFHYYKTGENIRSNLYKQKDDNMLSLISIFEMNNTGNWGIMLNDEQKIEDDNFLLLGFDVSELTMPIRLHIPKEILEKYMKNVHGSSVMRLYDGASDFSILNQRIPANGVYPMNQKFRTNLKKIKDIIKEDSLLYNFIMHCNYLIYQKEYTRSMKTLVGKNKKGKDRYSKIERYMNLENNEILTKKQLEDKNDRNLQL